jgi:anti-anti-sigma factor
MEITSQRLDDFTEVTARGRLDAYWADHFSSAIEEIMRQGNHRIHVNLSEVAYISSMGIRVLVEFYKKVEAINGVFAVSEASESVTKVLDMVGLRKTLMPSLIAAKAVAPGAPAIRELDRQNARVEVFDLAPGSLMKCSALGDPSLLEGCRFGPSNCRSLMLPESAFAIGLGAFGSNFEECKARFGEFLAVAGAAAYQPADGSNAPDFLLSEGALIPELQLLYGLVCDGSFASLARFESKAESGVVGLAELADACLEVSGADSACMVMVAESAGLVGASLRKPPVNGAGEGAPFTHPGIRRWLSFTTERAFPRALAVAVGVVARSSGGPLGPMLRPLQAKAGPFGHFHAAAFSYRPVQKGLIDLKSTVRPLFEQETPLGLLHLLSDDREGTGVSGSEFVRGACWTAPLTVVKDAA